MTERGDRMAKMNNITGQKFGYLTAIKPVGRSSDRHIIWLCICKCGNATSVRSNFLIGGVTRSCGCFQKERVSEANYRHGFRQQRETVNRIYRIWIHMRDRCNNPNNKDYYFYGNKGIKVCTEWNDFVNFYNWAMENGYSDSLEIDRINGERNYEPKNCRWVDDTVQARNTKRCIYQDVNGEQICLSEIAEKYGKTEAAMLWRYHHQGKRNEQLLEE